MKIANIFFYLTVVISLTACSLSDEKISVLKKEPSYNPLSRHAYNVDNREMALYTREANKRMSFVVRTKRGNFVGCTEPSPDALSSRASSFANKQDVEGKLTNEQDYQFSMAMQLATQRSQGLQLYRDAKIHQCFAIMNIISLIGEEEAKGNNPENIKNLTKKLDKALDRYYDDDELLKTLIPLLTKEAENAVTVNLPALPAPDLSKSQTEE